MSAGGVGMGYLKCFGFFVGRGSGGFSLVGGLAMAGMMGGLALLLANFSKQQQFVQKITETYFEVDSLFDIMARTLHGPEACKKTLGDGVAVVNARTVSAIKNKDGGVIFNTTDKYGNRLIEIESMTLRNSQITGTSGTVDIEVVVKKLSSVIKGYNKVTRKLPISVTVASGTTNLVRCHHKVDNLDQEVSNAMTNQVNPLAETKINDVVRELCTVFSGTYANFQCTLPTSP